MDDPTPRSGVTPRSSVRSHSDCPAGRAGLTHLQGERQRLLQRRSIRLGPLQGQMQNRIDQLPRLSGLSYELQIPYTFTDRDRSLEGGSDVVTTST